MNNREQYEVNRKLLNSYRWWRETNGELPDYDTIIAAGLSDIKITRSETNTRPFFLNLSKPLLLESEFNTYNLEYVVDNVRRSEDISMDNHIYLYFESLRDFAVLCMDYDLTYILGKEKVFFLIGEKSKKDNYPYDFKGKCGIDYESMPGRDVTIDELNRIIIDCPTDGFSGNVFMREILDAHPNLLTVKEWGMNAFPFFYERYMKNRTISEIKKTVEDSTDLGIRVEFGQMFIPEIDPKSESFDTIPVPSWEEFWKVLTDILEGHVPQRMELFKAFYLAYNKVLWGINNRERIIPAIRITTHSNGHTTVLYQQKKPYIESFKYIKQIQITRNPCMRLASQMSTALRNPANKNLQNHLNIWNSIGSYSYTIPEKRYMSAKWVKKAELCDDIRIIRFEDLKLHPEDSLKSLCSFLDVPFSSTMWHTSSNGHNSSTESSDHSFVEDYNPRPAMDYKPEFFSDNDVYRMEMIFRKEISDFGYEFKCYDGKKYSDDEIIDMFRKPFKFYSYLYTQYQRNYIKFDLFIDNVIKNIMKQQDIKEDGEKLYPIPYLDFNNGAEIFDKNDGHVIYNKDDNERWYNNSLYSNAVKYSMPSDINPPDYISITEYEFEKAFKEYSDIKESFGRRLEELRREINTREMVYLYGAGLDGRLIADELLNEIPSKRLCFLDKDKGKHGKEIYKNIKCKPLENVFGMGNKALILITSSRYADEIENRLTKSELQTKDKLKDVKIIKEYCVIRARLKENEVYIDDHDAILNCFRKCTDELSNFSLYRSIKKQDEKTLKEILESKWFESGKTTDGLGIYYERMKICNGRAVIAGPFLKDVLEKTRILWEDSDLVDVYEVNSLFCDMLKKKYYNDHLGDRISFYSGVVGEHNMTNSIDKYDGDDGAYAYLKYISGNTINIISLDSVYVKKEKLVNGINAYEERVGLIILTIENGAVPALLGMKELIYRDQPNLIIRTRGHFTLQKEYYWNVMNLIDSWGLEYKFVNRNIFNTGACLCAF